VTAPLLEVKHLSIQFKTSDGIFEAVDDVSFSIEPGEIFALVGESGCGKSTTAMGLMRLVAAPGSISNGQILFQGEDILAISEEDMTRFRGKEIGMIFQNPLDSLNPVATVGQQVSEAIVLDRVPREEAMKKVVDIFGSVKISDPKHRVRSYPHELSGGMRQRVMIGMMISRNPKLLIADEPTTALDVTIQAQILELCLELKAKYQTSILIITHDFGIVAEIADKVGVMYAGKIVEVGDVYRIFEKPIHPYTKLLMRALPQISKKEGRLETIPGTVPNLIDPPSGCRFHPRCPNAMDICRKVSPELQPGEQDHFFACHLGVTIDG
jgi:oligopeptide/dipeptide ABC transporter ATP-binding protein